MSEVSCVVISRQEFFVKFDLLLAEKKSLTIVKIFIPDKITIDQHGSKDKEEKLILDGFKDFTKLFPFVCYCTRFGWRIYLISLENTSQEIIESLKEILKIWEEKDSYFGSWRIAFTKTQKSKDQTRRLVADLEWLSVRAIDHSPDYKLFEIDLNKKLEIPIPLR